MRRAHAVPRSASWRPSSRSGSSSGAERAEVLLHVNGCARCQAYVAELTEAADAIPQLAPEAEPPAGFEARVLHRLGAGPSAAVAPPLDRGRSAVAAAAAAIVSITVVRVDRVGRQHVDGVGRDRDHASAREAGGRADGADGGAGCRPGGPTSSDGHGVAVAVSYGMASGGYRIAGQAARRSAENIGTMTVERQPRLVDRSEQPAASRPGARSRWSTPTGARGVPRHGPDGSVASRPQGSGV